MRGLVALLVACAPAVDREHVPETGTSVVEANGITFHYLEEGEGPLVLLLHGFPDTAHTWDRVRPALADAGYRAVSPFARGYAPTEIPDRDTDVETMGRDVIALIEALGEQQAIVVGHDWGAEHAYAAAHLAPERIERLVVVAIPHRDTLRLSPSTLWSGRHFTYLNRPSALRLMQRDDFAHVEELYARWAPTWELPAGELQHVKNAFALEPCLDAALGYYRANTLSTPDFMQHDLHVPTLLIGGRDDLLPEPAFTEDSRDRFAGPYQVEMLDGGHFVHRESPEAFERVLLEFLEG